MKGTTSIRRKEKRNYNFKLFCAYFGIIFRTHQVFSSVFARNIKRNLAFCLCRNTFCGLIFVFNRFKQCFKTSYAKADRYTNLQTHFSGKNNWRTNQVFRGLATLTFQGSRSILKAHSQI